MSALLYSNSFAEETPAYNIEIIIFKYNNPIEFSAESWPETWALPDINNSHEMFSKPTTKNLNTVAKNTTAEFLNGAKNARARKRGFKNLSYASYQLKDEVKKLRESSRYTVLKHIAWRQPGLSAKKAVPLRIRAGEAYAVQNFNQPATLSYELDGTIKVVLGRYLHVYTDLLYTHPVMQVAKSKISAGKEDGAPEKIIYETILAGSEQAGANLYGFSIKQHRRMRSKKLHHIDHPLIGMLVYATKVEDTAKK